MPSSFTALTSTGAISFLDIRKLFGGPAASGGSGGIQTYTIPGCYTFVVPNTTSTLAALLVGGGGAGASGSCTFFAGGGSGGGGGGGQVYSNNKITAGQGASITIHVGAGGVANTATQSGNGGASYLTKCGTTLANVQGGYGGYLSGVGGSSGGGGVGTSAQPGGCRVVNISTASTSFLSHSAGGGGGAGTSGLAGGGSWNPANVCRAGAGGSSFTVACFQGQCWKLGGGGGGGSPFIKSGLYYGAAGAANCGVGGAVGSPGHEGSDGFGGGGGGGGAGGVILSDTTQTNFVGWIDGANLYVCQISSLKLTVGAVIRRDNSQVIGATPRTNGTVITGTSITAFVRGSQGIGGAIHCACYICGVCGYNKSTMYAQFTVCPPQYAKDITSRQSSNYTVPFYMIGAYVGRCQAAARGATVASGAGGRGGSGGVYLYATDACAGPVPISCYYRGGPYVPNAPENSKIPLTGAIVVPCNFYGARGSYLYYYCLPNGQYDHNFCLLARAKAACPPYPNTGVPLQAFITVNGILGSVNDSTVAFDTGAGWTRPPKICVSIGATGVITGAGGTLSSRNAADAVGGDAMILRTPTKITNAGIIQGGGGAGYPAGNNSAGGAGYYGGVSNGSLFSGGPYPTYTYPSGKKGKSSRTVVGGGGGGWVSSGGASPSVDGWGYGQGGYGAARGGGPPGNAIINKSTYATLINTGTLRGKCQPLSQ